MDAITNGATIEIVATGERFHTLNDWGLAIGNNDYIGDVEQENYYVDVPGADGFLDFSEAITGRRIFKNRPISIELGGKKPRDNWDIFISDPYKYNVADSTEDWLWDSFDFETGIIDEGTEITVRTGETKTHTIVPDQMPFVPTIYVSVLGSAGLKMTANGETYTLMKGKNRFADITVNTEDVVLSFTGTGTLTIRYRRGSL